MADSGEIEHPRTPCRLFHRWRKHLRVNDAPMSMDPIVGHRVCQRCGKQQRYSYDSQGGCWVTVRAAVTPNQDDLLYDAWCVIANAHAGDWSQAPEGWRQAAEQWRDRWHTTLTSADIGRDEPLS